MTPRAAQWLQRLSAPPRSAAQHLRLVLGALAAGWLWWGVLVPPAPQAVAASLVWSLEQALRWGLVAAAYTLFQVHDLLLRGVADPLPKGWWVPEHWLARARGRSLLRELATVALVLVAFLALSALPLGALAFVLPLASFVLWVGASAAGVAVMLWLASRDTDAPTPGPPVPFSALPTLGFAGAGVFALPLYFGGFEAVESWRSTGVVWSRAAWVLLVAPLAISGLGAAIAARRWKTRLGLVRARALDADHGGSLRGAHDRVRSPRLASPPSPSEALGEALVRIGDRQAPGGVLKALLVTAIATWFAAPLANGAVLAAALAGAWWVFRDPMRRRLAAAKEELLSSSVHQLSAWPHAQGAARKAALHHVQSRFFLVVLVLPAGVGDWSGGALALLVGVGLLFASSVPDPPPRALWWGWAAWATVALLGLWLGIGVGLVGAVVALALTLRGWFSSTSLRPVGSP